MGFDKSPSRRIYINIYPMPNGATEYWHIDSGSGMGDWRLYKIGCRIYSRREYLRLNDKDAAWRYVCIGWRIYLCEEDDEDG